MHNKIQRYITSNYNNVMNLPSNRSSISKMMKTEALSSTEINKNSNLQISNLKGTIYRATSLSCRGSLSSSIKTN